MNYTQIREEAKHYVIDFFKTKGNKKIVYHNLSHTQAVVSSAIQIAHQYKLGEKEQFILTLAAWFHDTGYFTGESPAGHETRSAEQAAEFLQTKGVDNETILVVQQCIMATKMPQLPQNLPEQIICDADLYHFGTDDFSWRNKLLRKEAEWWHQKRITKNEWRKSSINFMKSHQYHTDYCRTVLQDKKQENINKMKQQVSAEEMKITGNDVDQPVLNKQPGLITEKVTAKKDKIERPDRGIETMFRISSGNHQRLSDMADNKAHIMITTTSIIISVLLSVLLRKLEDNPHLIIPTMILLTVCVITMVCSILATRPSLPEGTFTQQDIDTRKVNLLFFGNFYKMSFDEYASGIQQMMNDRDFLYGSLTKDVYSQGIVLGRKYRLLRTGYNVFMYGIIASVIAFFIAAVFFG